MSELIISVAGLRGVVGETLTPDVAMRYAAAFSAAVKEAGPFVITRDSRPSGAMLADAIHAALNASGRDTIDAGIAATPTTGILIRQYHAAGGIQISASHNPGEYNGMKLFTAEGRVIPKQPGSSVLEAYKLNQFHWVRFGGLGTKTVCSDSTAAHLQAVLQSVDAAAVAARKFKVLLDANHGAGAVLGVKVLKALNCGVTVLGEEPNGQFLHTPEPTADNLAGVSTVAQKELQGQKAKYDVIFCQDPDADRLAIIDGNGRYIGEEYTLALCLEHVLAKRHKEAANPSGSAPSAVVINCATSRMSEDIAAGYGAKIYRSAVGEANVVDLMLAKQAVFGGEGNGGPINPAVGYVRDSFVGMALILDMMAKTGKSVAELADSLPKYALVKRKTTVELAKVPAMLDKAAAAFKTLPCDRMDGLRIDHGDAWVLLRGSNTEPIIRIFAEAPTAERANKLCDEIENVLH
ncbi:MAG: phosphoglucosamine mutase [Planctomycetaceae bacterium]|jgi:phosphomannomutase|nr:phosphoglucosamine mutase [Planctomycetaceae bacterium]